MSKTLYAIPNPGNIDVQPGDDISVLGSLQEVNDAIEYDLGEDYTFDDLDGTIVYKLVRVGKIRLGAPKSKVVSLAAK